MKRLTVNASKALCAFVLCMGLLFSGCYDDADLRAQLKEHSEQLSDHESRLKELERLCSQTNTNIEALQAIVTALNDRDYVTGVAPIMEGKIVLGYTITFSKSGPVTIYHGQDGQNGTAGYAPALGVKQDGEEWYWTVDGQWLTDADGNKVRASAKDGQDGKPGNDGAAGVTPTLKIEDGYWYVSYDGGKTWESESLGQATGDRGDSMFETVSYDAEYVYITMADGQELVLPRTSVSSNEGEPVAVQFKSNVVTTVGTKAQGSFDKWNGNQTLYIYGFQRQDVMDYTVTPLIDNETPDVKPLPAPQNFLTITRIGESGNLIPYYYQGNNTYDFFGYYIDVLVPVPQKMADGVYVPVALTGGEDVMLAAADPKTDAGSMLSDYRYAYSAYAARRDVHPTLNFKHQLVQFNFKIESGYKKYNANGYENPELVVKGLTIKARNKADLCVAGKTTGFTNIDNTLAELELRSLVDGQLKKMEEYIVPDRNDVVSEESKVIGHSLMVIPNEPSADDTYDIVLTMVYDGETVTQEAKIKFSEVKDAVAEQTQFTAGYAYEVAIKVYGLEPIEIKLTMDEWKAGGTVFIE